MRTQLDDLALFFVLFGGFWFGFFFVCKLIFFLNQSSNIQIVGIFFVSGPETGTAFRGFLSSNCFCHGHVLYSPFHQKKVSVLEAARDPPFSVFTLTTVGKLLLNPALWVDGNLPF